MSSASWFPQTRFDSRDPCGVKKTNSVVLFPKVKALASFSNLLNKVCLIHVRCLMEGRSRKTKWKM